MGSRGKGKARSARKRSQKRWDWASESLRAGMEAGDQEGGTTLVQGLSVPLASGLCFIVLI